MRSELLDHVVVWQGLPSEVAQNCRRDRITYPFCTAPLSSSRWPAAGGGRVRRTGPARHVPRRSLVEKRADDSRSARRSDSPSGAPRSCLGPPHHDWWPVATPVRLGPPATRERRGWPGAGAGRRRRPFPVGASSAPTGSGLQRGWIAAQSSDSNGLPPRKSLIRLDFIEHKSERSVMPQDTGVGRNVGLDGLDFASLRRVWEQTFGATPPSSLLARFPAPCSLARTPVPDPWRAFGYNPAHSGRHGERDIRQRRSRRVRFCRHPSRPVPKLGPFEIEHQSAA